MTERRFQEIFDFSALRVANRLRDECYTAGLNRNEVSCLEFVMVNRSARLTGGNRVDAFDWLLVEHERMRRITEDGYWELAPPKTVIELAGGFQSLKQKGMVEEIGGALRLPVIELTSDKAADNGEHLPEVQP